MNKFSKRLGEFIPELATSALAGLEVSGICQDSRKVQAGDLFIARAGGAVRGTDFIPQAQAAGARAILVDESEAADLTSDLPLARIAGLNRRLGELAAAFYDHPSRAMTLIGITGTNGKTSCSHFIAQALNNAGTRTAVIGTIGNGFPGALTSASHTTPDAVGLQQLLAAFRAAGAAAVVMEVSSHALEQHRVAGVAFDLAAFTNLSRDHLDYHGTMANYGAAKAMLFQQYPLAGAVICTDDAFGVNLADSLDRKIPLIRVGEARGDIHCCRYRLASGGIQLQLETPWGAVAADCAVVGHYNLHNLMLTCGILGQLGFDAERLNAALEGLRAVPGRMQCIGGEGEPLVVVDYAHTPDALEKALQAVRRHTRGRLYCVFGCGGDRDRGKRPEMGRIAAALADVPCLTSDNPRSESPEAIIEMVLAGIDERQRVQVEPDRARAIRAAILAAEPGDVVLIAGKGHEDYQEINGQRLPFLDEHIARASLRERNS